MAAEPFYFGREEHLFGFYHPPAVARRNHGVVICPPLLNEYMRSHHALRRIATTLAERGYDVLRFDFSGQGNSSRSMAEVTCLDWGDDVVDAMTELESIAGSEKLSVVAVRFACSLVALQAQSSSLAHFVCWDPVFDGAEWLATLQGIQRKLKATSRSPEQIKEHEYMGYETSAAFALALERHRCLPANEENLFVVQTAAESGANDRSTVTVPFPCGWEDMSSQILYPHEVIAAVCKPFAQ